MLENYELLITSTVQSALVTICSEIGDKTFFCIALLAMKHHTALIILSATAALVLMTFLSAFLGSFLPALLSPVIITLVSTLLFLLFGIRLLVEAASSFAFVQKYAEWMFNKDSKDYETPVGVESPLNSALIEASPTSASSVSSKDTALQDADTASIDVDIDETFLKKHTQAIPSTKNWHIFAAQCFMLVFMAEWGDRSQIAVVTFAASTDWVGVAVGASIGHFLCIFIAAIGGKYLSRYIPEQAISFLGGCVFICCGIINYMLY